MDKKRLRKLQLEQLKIAQVVKHVCEKHNIDYFLDSGTLLGAVRHKGFIPWDDDFDFGMTRDNYERFLKIAQNEMGEEYYVQTWTTDEKYGSPYAKIRRVGTVYIETNSMMDTVNNGIFIDILPYDNAPDHNSRISSLSRKLTVLRFMIQVKSGYNLNTISDENNKIKYLIKFFALFTSRSSLINTYNRLAQKLNSQKTEFMYAQTGTAKLGTWRIKSNILLNLTELKFEDEMFKSPSSWDEYLREAYGDYMILPPISKQQGGHSIKILKFKEFNE